MRRKKEQQDLAVALQEKAVTVTAHKHTDKNTDDSPLWHEALEIKRFFTGGTSLVIGDAYYRSEPGDIYVINPLVPHSTSDDDLGNDYHLVLIDLARLPELDNGESKDLLDEIISGYRMFPSRIPNDNKVIGMVDSLAELFMKSDKPDDLSVIGQTFLLLGALGANSIKAEGTDRSTRETRKMNEKLAPALSMIHSEYTRALTLAELADACGFNERYFCRLFHQRTGMTAMQYCNRLRIENARVLLRTTKMTVSEIASECGFSDVPYFYRCFRTAMKCTPGEYREQVEE